MNFMVIDLTDKLRCDCFLFVELSKVDLKVFYHYKPRYFEILVGIVAMRVFLGNEWIVIVTDFDN